jgi:TATA-box binding protein (TBP) (component of TFIID and TFIIIB)
MKKKDSIFIFDKFDVNDDYTLSYNIDSDTKTSSLSMEELKMIDDVEKMVKKYHGKNKSKNTKITIDNNKKSDIIGDVPSVNENNTEKKLKDDFFQNILNEKIGIDGVENLKKYMSKHKIQISTMTLKAYLGTPINCLNIAKYIDLNIDSIVSVKYGDKNDKTTNRRIYQILTGSKKKGGKAFYNQVTLEIKPDKINDNEENNAINVKIFKNGSLQMTGCKRMIDCYNVIGKLINILKFDKCKMYRTGEVHDIKFVTDSEKLSLQNLRVAMINSNFKLDYLISRDDLYELLYNNDVECKYHCNIHACVNIKYNYVENKKSKKISIFVFQSGSIIITGANNIKHIVAAHDYIMKIINKYKTFITIRKIDKKIIKKILAQKYPTIKIY